MVSVFQQFKSWAAGAIMKAGESVNFTPSYKKYAWPDFTLFDGIRNGYKGSSAVTACMRALTFSFPEPPLNVYQLTKDGELPVDYTHPMQALIRNPNPDMGEAEFMQFCIAYAAPMGNVYLWKERSKNGKVLHLWPWSDKDIRPVAGHNSSEGIVSGYEFNCGDGTTFSISKNDIIHWKWMIDPLNPWRGMGALECAWRDIASDNESSQYAYTMFKSNGIPPFIITLADGDELNDERVERLLSEWKKRYGKKNRSGLPGFLEYGMQVQKLGWNMQEMDLSNLKNIPESRICAAFGVPATIAGLYVGLKRSDYGDGEARKSYAESTLVALWRTFASEVTNGLRPEFGSNLVCHFDLDAVRALQENVNAKWERLGKAWNDSAITRAMFLRMVGLKYGPEDEVYKVSLVNTFEPAGKALTPTPSRPSGTGEGEGKAQKGRSALRPYDGVTGEEEEKSNMVPYGRALQRIRLTMASRMIKDMDDYFSSLADRVISRAEKSLRKGAETKKLPSADDLLTEKDEKELTKVIKRWFVAIAQASWETINLSIGLTAAFDETDPAITFALSRSAADVTEITSTTRTAIQEVLQYGNEQGWSIQELVSGDEEHDGLKKIVEETYKNRSRTIARTELGNAQNDVAAERYKTNGVNLVEILDNGDTDDDEECKIANGQIWTVEYFEANTLEHPNCTRTCVPYFGDQAPDRSLE
jgi:HK97 family phage portal protein